MLFAAQLSVDCFGICGTSCVLKRSQRMCKSIAKSRLMFVAIDGDLGVLDSDGYLRITGRIKELINRGGEKISPTEIDAVLLSDPAVAEAVAFAVPAPIYGEEIHAAVVLQADVTAAALQAYCRSHLSDFEIPKVIHVVKELPKDSTGKVERRLLTELFAK